MSEKDTFYQRFFNFHNLLITLIVSFALLTFLAKQIPYFTFDLSITHFIQNINIPLFPELMEFISWLGNVYPTIFSVGLICLTIWFFKKPKEALMIFISTSGIILLSQIFKFVVHRPRPDPSLISQIGSYQNLDSFPSGHVLYFIGFYGFLLFLIYTSQKVHLTRSTLIFILLLMMFLIGMSRIYLGAHWFSDVLGSYLIGTLWLYLMTLLYKRIKN